MTLNQANELAMKWVDAAKVSETTRNQMFSAVAWFLFKADKEGYELVPKKRELKLGDCITRAEVMWMLEDGVAY